MHTYFVGDEEVRRYAADFAQRLIALGSSVPKTWITLGISGDKMAFELGKCVENTLAEPTDIVRTMFKRDAREIVAHGGK